LLIDSKQQLLIPPELTKALKSSPTAKAKYNRMSFEKRLEFAWYVAEAKRPETRLRRAEKVLDRIGDSSKNKKTQKKHVYSKMYEETHDFRQSMYDKFAEFINKHRPNITMQLNNELCDLRNQLSALFLSWVGSKKLETKYGVKLSLHSKVINVGLYSEKQARIAGKNYIPCEICGDNRVTHFCHILPKSFGGPDVPENFIYLCPTHHHLFDHSRLLESEWEKIDFSKKMTPAQEYVNNVRKQQLQTFWDEQKSQTKD